MGKRKHAKAGKAYELPLDFLDPADFPDLEAVRSFFTAGSAYRTALIALEEALAPRFVSEGNGKVPDEFLRTARNAGDRLLQDLQNITLALAHGKPVRAVHGPEWGEEGRAHILALTLAAAPGWREDLQQEFFRILVDRPVPAAAEARV